MRGPLDRLETSLSAAIITSVRRSLYFLMLFLTACQPLVRTPVVTPTSSAVTPLALHSPSVPALPTVTSAPATPTVTASSESGQEFEVRLHPDGGLYVGDLVSLEVIAPEGLDYADHSVAVLVEDVVNQEPWEEEFNPFGIGGRPQATFMWVWDTAGLAAGEYAFTFSIEPDGPTWQEMIRLLPSSEVPPPQPGATWSHAESDCCLVYTITGTASYRDLEELLDIVDEQAQDVTRRLGANLGEPLTITFLPRVLGHGGFAGQELSVSYLDRNYAGGFFEIVLHHELVHILDASLGGDLRPTMLVEGLAVYLSGGHFKPEPILERAAALLPPRQGCVDAAAMIAERKASKDREVCGLDWYMPMVPLLDDFYRSQHEIGYMQAAAVVEFMVLTWGWEAFSEFYRDIQYPLEDASAIEHGEQRGPQAAAMNTALVRHFGLTVEQLEGRFLAALGEVDLRPEWAEDVRLSVGFYDSVRRYQQMLDPSAYFLAAWQPDRQQMRERGIVADYVRRPSDEENLTLETMLVSANSHLQSGDFVSAGELLAGVNAALDGIAQGDMAPFSAHPMASDYLAVVRALLAEGFQPQRIDWLDENMVRAWVIASGPEINTISLLRTARGWSLLERAD